MLPPALSLFWIRNGVWSGASSTLISLYLEGAALCDDATEARITAVLGLRSFLMLFSTCRWMVLVINWFRLSFLPLLATDRSSSSLARFYSPSSSSESV
jgi:hypothetical protein